MNGDSTEYQIEPTNPAPGDDHHSRNDRSRRRRRRRLPTVRETSAGGLVVDETRTYALVIRTSNRKGRLLWTLPKGHVARGESHGQTAVREIFEETGIKARVLAPIGRVNYRFSDDRRYIHKTVHEFLLEAVGGALSAADREVVQVAWKPLSRLDDLLAHAGERRVVRGALESLAATPPVHPRPAADAVDSIATAHDGTGSA